MVFGEIVEPSTRALVIDEEEEFIEYPFDYSFRLDWDGTGAVPDVINSLIFVESPVLLRLLDQEFLKHRIYSTIKNVGVRICALNKQDYLVVTANIPEGFTHAEVVENFSDWIEKAKNVYCITTKPIALYTSCSTQESSEIFIRSLVYKAKDFNYKKLESPNLATGIAAAVMSFCVFKNKSCSLFIVYVPSAPLDSLTARPVLELFNKLDVSINCQLNADVSSSNLYM